MLRKFEKFQGISEEFRGFSRILKLGRAARPLKPIEIHRKPSILSIWGDWAQLYEPPGLRGYWTFWFSATQKVHSNEESYRNLKIFVVFEISELQMIQPSYFQNSKILDFLNGFLPPREIFACSGESGLGLSGGRGRFSKNSRNS